MKVHSLKFICKLCFSICLIIVLFFLCSLPITGSNTEKVLISNDLPSNPLAGRLIFEKKGCTDCHGIRDIGDKIGPYLGRENIFNNFYDVASRLWNHAPRMEIRSGSLKMKWPTMNKTELKQLIAFLFFLRYLGEPGNVENGKKLIRKKTCLSCHRIGKEGSPDGISLDQLTQHASPLYIAQVIWNHGPTMEEQMKVKGIKRPSFKNGDISDISAYLREYSRGQSLNMQFMSPGNPKAGGQLFLQKRCIKCHSIGKSKDSIGPSLYKLDLHMGVTAIAARMWNHGSTMETMMKTENISWPEFKDSEMADLIAFLYFTNYYGPDGIPEKGKKVFDSKSCIRCHGPETIMPLSKSNTLKGPGELVRTMWNHVPHMHELTLSKNIQWPTLNEEELRNLYAYLIKISPK